MYQYFTIQQIIPFIVSAVLSILSIIFFHNDKKGIALSFLFLSSIGWGYFIANLDHFLIIWDEQYHALVSKNLIKNPFKPILYPVPLLEYDYTNWTANYVWLHKQPLFLWQIALSLKIFGITELSVRIPSILLHSIIVIMIYRIGKIAHSSTVGFYGALFFSMAYYPLELVAGKYSTDHNDIAFLFYVTASFVAWFEYQSTSKAYWLILIGFFSGCAILVKWLVGLVIYAIWGISILANDKRKLLELKSYYPILLAFSVTLIVFLPWQLYILYSFPLEAKYEFDLNSEHFFRAVEDHGGDWGFHFNAIRAIYGHGQAVPFLILFGLFLFIKNSVNRIYKAAIISAIVITYSFYTLAATKMTSFCIIVSPFGFLALAALIEAVVKFMGNKIRYRTIGVLFKTVVLISISLLLLDFSRIQNYHTNWKPHDNCNREADLDLMSTIGKISDELGDEKYVVFNANLRGEGHIAMMFYTNYIAYNFIPDRRQIEKIKSQAYKIAILDTGGYIPGYIIDDKEIKKVFP